MEKYSVFLQLCAIFAIFYLIYVLYKFIISIIKRNRISYFSINLDKKEYSSGDFIFVIIHKFSKFLKSLVIFNGISRTYDKYIDEESKFESGMDYISLKILLGFLFIIIYLFMSFLFKNTISSLVILTCFILGFILSDFYCIYLGQKMVRISRKDILRAVIVIGNSYRANRSTEQVIGDVIERVDGALKREFKKVLNDIRLGISLGEAFKRRYIRVGNKEILEISRMILISSKIGLNKIEMFDDIEKRLVDEETFYNDLKVIQATNKISFWVFLILPLLFITYLIAFNKNYLNLIISSSGIIIVLIFMIMYLLYVFIIYRIMKGRCI